MTDRPETTDQLMEFTVSIDWHALRPSDVQAVIARTQEDAVAIARVMFRRSHTTDCVIDAAAVVQAEPVK